MEIGNIEILSSCGEWKQNDVREWEFIIDADRGSSCSEVEENISFNELIQIMYEDFIIDPLKAEIKLSYCIPLSMGLKNVPSPPIYIRNDRQLRTFIKKLKGGSETMMLCVKVVEKFSIQSEKGRHVENDIQRENQHNEDSNRNTQVVDDELNVNGSGMSFYVEPNDTCSTADKESESIPLHSAPAVGRKTSSNCSPPTANDIYVKRSFKSKEEMMLRMRQWALDWNFEFKTHKSDGDRVILRCVDMRCSWWMRASKLSSGYFEIRKYVHEHTCDTTNRNPNNNRQATVKTIASLISGEKKDGLNPKQIIELVKRNHGVDIDYRKAVRVTETLMRGKLDERYMNIAKWLYMAKETNPGTVTYFESSQGKFMYSFLAFGASLRGFRLMRKVIAVDGTVLKGNFKGTLLCATAQDGDYHLYPLAYAIVDSENDESWNWFFRCLESVIPDAPDLVFVSSFASSIAKAVAEVYPSTHHAICRFQFEKDIEARFKIQGLIDLVRAAANAYTVVEFTEIFHAIEKFSQSLGKYLQEADVSKWARCYAPVNRYNMMTTMNIAESLDSMLNSTCELPILYETIRVTLNTWFLERRVKAANHDEIVTPNVVKNLVEKYDEAVNIHDVLQVNEDEFEVKKGNDMFIVNLDKKDCSCRVFNVERIPCVHAIAAVKRIGRDVYEYVDEFHSTKTWAEAYVESIHRNGDEKNWSFPESLTEFLCAPPSTRGRPAKKRPEKKKRKRSVGQYREPGSKSKKRNTCSRCSQVGHNMLTCDVAI